MIVSFLASHSSRCFVAREMLPSRLRVVERWPISTSAFGSSRVRMQSRKLRAWRAVRSALLPAAFSLMESMRRAGSWNCPPFSGKISKLVPEMQAVPWVPRISTSPLRIMGPPLASYWPKTAMRPEANWKVASRVSGMVRSSSTIKCPPMAQMEVGASSPVIQRMASR